MLRSGGGLRGRARLGAEGFEEQAERRLGVDPVAVPAHGRPNHDLVPHAVRGGFEFVGFALGVRAGATPKQRVGLVSHAGSVGDLRK